MKPLSAKYKIFITLMIWLGVAFFAIGYLFNILENSNGLILNEINQQQKELTVLENERDNFILAKQDLSALEEKAYQPEYFFNSDQSFINEIKIFEDLAKKLNLQMNISGLAGTIETLPKAPAKAELFIVPYRLSLNGQFADVVAFIEHLENLPFVTTVSSVSVTGSSGDKVNAGLVGSFFLKKN